MGKYEKKEPFLKRNARIIGRWLGYLLFLLIGIFATKLLGLEALLEKIPDSHEADMLYSVGLIIFVIVCEIISALTRKKKP